MTGGYDTTELSPSLSQAHTRDTHTQTHANTHHRRVRVLLAVVENENGRNRTVLLLPPTKLAPRSKENDTFERVPQTPHVLDVVAHSLSRGTACQPTGA